MLKLKDLLGRKRPAEEGVTAEDHLLRQISELRRAHDEATLALHDVGARRQELLLNDDDKAVERLERDSAEHRRTIEKVALVLPGLELQLALQRETDLRARWDFHLGELRAAFSTVKEALTAALRANEAATRAKEAAFGDLGRAGRNLPQIHFPPLAPALVEHWIAFTSDEVARVQIASDGSGVRLSRDLPPFKKGDVVTLPARAAQAFIDRGDGAWIGGSLPPERGNSFEHRSVPVPELSTNSQRGVALFEPPPPSAAPEKPRPASSDGGDAVKREPRPSLPDTVPEGNVRCRVLRAGYPAPEGGAYLLAGDLLDVETGTAEMAVMNSALEYAPEAGAPANNGEDAA
jgi:hypothetical protein